MTKYLNGHSDAVMGVAIMRDKKIYDQLKFLQNAIGAIPSPFDCYLVQRGLKTLAVRMQRHEENASGICSYLVKQVGKYVESVLYPGLPSHPGHVVASKQQSGYGGMISFTLVTRHGANGLEIAQKFLESLKIFTLAESLGGVESLAELPALMTHASVSTDDRLALGITDTLIRLSVGIEDLDDLINDLRNAFEEAYRVCF